MRKMNSMQQYSLLKGRWWQSQTIKNLNWHWKFKFKYKFWVLHLPHCILQLVPTPFRTFGWPPMSKQNQTNTDLFVVVSLPLSASVCAAVHYILPLTSSVIPVNPTRRHGREEFTPKHCQCQLNSANCDGPGWTFRPKVLCNWPAQ